MTKNLILLSPFEAADRSASEIISQIKTHLRELAKELWSEESYSSLNQELRELSRNKSISWSNISSCWKNATTEEDPAEAQDSKTAKIHFTYASIYYHNAHAKLILNDLQKTASLTTYAAYHIGALDNHIKVVKAKKRNKERASTGGKRLSGMRSEIRTHLMRLLENPPAGGWKDIPSTARILAPMLEKFVFNKKLGRVVYDAAEFIITEIEKNGKPQKAFRKHQKAQKAL